MSNGRPWTHEDTAWLRRLARGGMGDAEIAREMGRPDRSFIAKKRAEHNIERGLPARLVAAMARLNLRRQQRKIRENSHG